MARVSFFSPDAITPQTPAAAALQQFGARRTNPIALNALQEGTSSAPLQGGIGEGFTRLGNALLGGFMLGDDERRGTASRNRVAQALVGSMSEADRASPRGQALLSMIQDPDLGGPAIAAMLPSLTRGAPEAPTGMRYNAQGGLDVIPGYAAAQGQIAEAGRDPVITTPEGPFLRSALLPGGGAPGGGAPQAAVGQPPEAAAAAPGAPNPSNPGNMRVPGQTAFQAFRSPEEGVAGMVRQLGLYGQRGITTPLQIAQTWAPRGDGANDPTAYAATIQRLTGMDPNQPVDLSNPQQLQALVGAMAQVEQGLPLDPQVLARGLAMAPPGVGRQPLQPMAGAPSTMPGRMPGEQPVQVAQAGGQTATDAASPPRPVSDYIPDRNGQTAAPLTLPEPGDDVPLQLRRRPGALMQGPTHNDIATARAMRTEHLGQREVQYALRTSAVLHSMEDAISRPSAASDLNLIYGIVTIMDPNSAVKEGEQTTVRSTQGLPARLQGTIDQVLRGNATLQPEDRQRIMEEARSRARGVMTNYDHIRRGDERLLRAANINPDAALGPRLQMPAARPAPTAPAVTTPGTAAPAVQLPPGVTPQDVLEQARRRGIQ